jgi:acyl-CoA thioester hydrolase
VSAHEFSIRVYYEDTDFSGVVYHASYLRFMERGRTEMLRARGIEQAGLTFGFAVRAMQIDYLKPARMDDLLTIKTKVSKMGGASLDMEQRVLRGSEVLVTATVRIACLAEGKAARLPADVRARLEA